MACRKSPNSVRHTCWCRLDVLTDRIQRDKVDLDAHRGNHRPDQRPRDEIYLRALHPAEVRGPVGQRLTRGEASYDRQRDPRNRIAFEELDRGHVIALP